MSKLAYRDDPSPQPLMDLSQLQKDMRVAICQMMSLEQLLKLPLETQRELLQAWGFSEELAYEHAEREADQILATSESGRSKGYKGAFIPTSGGRCRYVAVNAKGVALIAAEHEDDEDLLECFFHHPDVRIIKLQGEGMDRYGQRRVARILARRIDRAYRTTELIKIGDGLDAVWKRKINPAIEDKFDFEIEQERAKRPRIIKSRDVTPAKVKILKALGYLKKKPMAPEAPMDMAQQTNTKITGPKAWISREQIAAKQEIKQGERSGVDLNGDAPGAKSESVDEFWKDLRRSVGTSGCSVNESLKRIRKAREAACGEDGEAPKPVMIQDINGIASTIDLDEPVVLPKEPEAPALAAPQELHTHITTGAYCPWPRQKASVVTGKTGRELLRHFRVTIADIGEDPTTFVKSQWKREDIERSIQDHMRVHVRQVNRRR